VQFFTRGLWFGFPVPPRNRSFGWVGYIYFWFVGFVWVWFGLGLLPSYVPFVGCWFIGSGLVRWFVLGFLGSALRTGTPGCGFATFYALLPRLPALRSFPSFCSRILDAGYGCLRVRGSWFVTFMLVGWIPFVDLLRLVCCVTFLVVALPFCCRLRLPVCCLRTGYIAGSAVRCGFAVPRLVTDHVVRLRFTFSLLRLRLVLTHHHVYDSAFCRWFAWFARFRLPFVNWFRHHDLVLRSVRPRYLRLRCVPLRSAQFV